MRTPFKNRIRFRPDGILTATFLARLLVCVCAGLNLSAPASAQVQEAWAAYYPTNLDRSGQSRALTVDGEGNVYITGFSATVKYDSSGHQLWATNGGEALALDTAGNVYVA